MQLESWGHVMQTVSLLVKQGVCGTVALLQSARELADFLRSDDCPGRGTIVLDCQFESLSGEVRDEVKRALSWLPTSDQRRLMLAIPTTAGSDGARLLQLIDATTAVRVGWRVDEVDENSLAVIEAWSGALLVIGQSVAERCITTGHRADLLEMQQAAGMGTLTLLEGDAGTATDEWLRRAGVSAWFEPGWGLAVAAVPAVLGRRAKQRRLSAEPLDRAA